MYKTTTLTTTGYDPMASVQGTNILESREEEKKEKSSYEGDFHFKSKEELHAYINKSRALEKKRQKRKPNTWHKVEYLPRAMSDRPNKTGMPDYMLDNLEALSGYDMSDVRVHRNSPFT